MCVRTVKDRCKLEFISLARQISNGYGPQHNNKVEYLRVKIKTDAEGVEGP
jgi:hypothetical protein